MTTVIGIDKVAVERFSSVMGGGEDHLRMTSGALPPDTTRLIRESDSGIPVFDDTQISRIDWIITHGYRNTRCLPDDGRAHRIGTIEFERVRLDRRIPRSRPRSHRRVSSVRVGYSHYSHPHRFVEAVRAEDTERPQRENHISKWEDYSRSLGLSARVRDGREPVKIALDETVVKVNGERFSLYAAVDPETTVIPHVGLYPTGSIIVTELFLRELKEKRSVDDADLFGDGAPWLQAGLIERGMHFRHETFGERNPVERIFQEIKR